MSAPAPGGAKERRILIVDDDESVLSLLTHIVKREGFAVETATDGERALEAIEAAAPDAVILDLMMPRYGGFEVLRRLQAAAAKKIPVIVVTGRYTDRSTADLVRQESNVVDFLEKPVKADLLAAAVRRAVGSASPGR